MQSITQRPAGDSIRFKRGWNNRPVGSTATVAAFGFGLCQTLVDCGKADWIDTIEAAVPPTPGVESVASLPRAEADEGRKHRRR